MTQAFVLVTVALAVAVPLLVVLKRLAHPDWSQPLQLMRLQSEEAATRMRQLREEIGVSIKAVGDSVAKSLYVSPSAGTPATVETELTTLTEANRTSAMQLREEIAVSSQALTDSLVRSMNEIVETQQNQLAVLGRHLLALAKTTEEKLDELRGAVEMRLSASPEASVTRDRPTECNPLKREDLATGLRALNDSIESNLNEIAVLQKNEFDGVAEHLRALADANEKNVDGMRSVAEEQARRMQEDSAVKIDQFCVAVDEKLRRTLERGLGDSLQPVSDRLEQIYEGIGEIRALAAGSDDEIRTPVDARPEGAWEEVYLGNLLGRVLPPEQFEPRVVTRKGSGERVEFAVRLPARDEDGQDPTWLPIASCPRKRPPAGSRPSLRQPPRG
jgi:DNA recombination protein RmuC